MVSHRDLWDRQRDMSVRMMDGAPLLILEVGTEIPNLGWWLKL